MVPVALLAATVLGILLSAADNGASVPLAPPAAPMIVTGPGTERLRIEALDDHIVRIWFKPAGSFSRPLSLAMADAPVARVPLTVREEGGAAVLGTQALAVRVNRATLVLMSPPPATARGLMTDARITTRADGIAWTLAHRVAAGEKLLGLGEDNENTGRLDRRGTDPRPLAGQQIKSGNVTAQFPIPLLLSTGRNGHAYGVFYDKRTRAPLRSRPVRARRGPLRRPRGRIDLTSSMDAPGDVVERYTSHRAPLPAPLWRWDTGRANAPFTTGRKSTRLISSSPSGVFPSMLW